MPVTLMDRLPLPNLKVYTAGSVLLLSMAVYHAIGVTSDPAWRANATLQRQEALAAGEGMVPAVETLDLANGTRNLTEQFVDVMTFMMQEPLCMWTVINIAYCSLALLGFGIQRLVFGQLRVSEAQRVKDKFWNYVFYKFIFVFGVINVQYMDEVLLWCSWFTLVGFLHLMGQLCKDRFEYLVSSPQGRRWAHARLATLLACILLSGGPLLGAAVVWGLPAGRDTFAFMAAECILVQLSALHVLARYVLQLRDADAAGPLAYYTHLVFDSCLLVVELGHVVHMVVFSNMLVSMPALVLLLQLRHLLHELQARLARHRLYTQLRSHMSRHYPMASKEEVEKNQDNCAICWEPMKEARKLPCSHLFHKYVSLTRVVYSYPMASKEEVEKNQDNCAICWEPMKEARKLPCSHLFHKYVSLTRVVYSYPMASKEEVEKNQDNCAICWEPMKEARKLPCSHLFHKYVSLTRVVYSYPMASKEEVEKNQDNCAICWEPMKEARKLPCSHLFHKYVSLTRVVYSYPMASKEEVEKNQDNCAICWEPMKEARKLPCSHLFHKYVSLTRVVYSYPMASKEEVEKNQDNCAICWEPMKEARKLPCSHLFHKYVSLTRVVYSYPMASKEEVEKNQDNCAICWEPMKEARKLPCSHLFHNSCLCQWVQQDASCPTCRRALRARVSASSPAPPSTGPAAPPHPNHLFHFDGSRYVSWLPSFSVEVTRVRAAPPPPNILDGMARQVQQMFPHYSVHTLLADLATTRSPDLTVENILEGRLLPSVLEPFSPEPETLPETSPPPPTATPAELAPVPVTPSPSPSPSPAPHDANTSTAAHAHTHVHRSTHTHDHVYVGRDDDVAEPGRSHFSSQASEREALLQRRKLQLVAAARDRYLARRARRLHPAPSTS